MHTVDELLMKRDLHMKKLLPGICLMGCIVYAHPVYAQTEESITLDEVTIKAQRVVNRPDGWLIYPSDVQKTSSHTGYSLLQKMSLPNIRINEIDRTVSAIDNKGAVQLRINGIEVGTAEMLLLDPKSIRKVEFIDNPGVRYGEGIAYVFNIITHRGESGYTIGTDLTQTATVAKGDGMLYGKWNVGKSEWALSYNGGYQSTDGYRNEETARYRLNDGSIRTITRKDVDSKRKLFANDVKLTYNLADGEDYVFQTSLSGSFLHTPTRWYQKEIFDSGKNHSLAEDVNLMMPRSGVSSPRSDVSTIDANVAPIIATDRSNSKSGSPVLDIYFSRNLPKNQSIVFNAVGTYIQTSSSSAYDEGDSYVYDVEGKTYSFMSEGIYEKKFKPLTFSAGINYKQKYTKNEYTGSTAALNNMHNSRVYLFADATGSWNDLRYSAGVGVSYLHYSQDEHTYDDWTFCPKLSLTYSFTKELQLNYTFSAHERMSQIAMISQAAIRTNSMEWTVGSPNLKPSLDVENLLRLSYNTSRWNTFVDVFYKNCHHPNMALYYRTEDNQFIHTQTNQDHISVLQAMLYANYWLVPEKLSLSAYGGLFRCFNFGDNYTHCYTSYFVNGSLNAYLGNFTLSAMADNGFRHLEGETKGVSGYQATFQAAYNYKDWQFGINYSLPFVNHYKMFEAETLNENLYKKETLYSTDAGNYVSLNVAWRFHKGRKHRAPQRTLNLKDTDTGIMSK